MPNSVVFGKIHSMSVKELTFTLGFQKSPCQEIFGELVNPYPIVFK